MENIFQYWIKISKDLSKKKLGYSKNIWKWNNFKNEILSLKGNLGINNKYINILGIHIDFNTGIGIDTILKKEYKINHLIDYLFYYSKAKDIGLSNEWINYNNLMKGYSSGVVPFRKKIENLRIEIDLGSSKIFDVIEKISDSKSSFGDISYIIRPLPYIYILLVYKNMIYLFFSNLNSVFVCL